MTDLAEILAAYLLGFAVAALLWAGGRRIFAGPVFERRNYRDHPLPTAVGALLPVAAAAVVGIHIAVFDLWRSVFGAGSTGWSALNDHATTTMALALAFAFLGLVDDLGGRGESGGFTGHLKALFEGRITTGLIKLVGGPLFALVIIAGGPTPSGRVGHLRDAALVCLAANLANLFDRAPGRVNKVGHLAFVVLALAALDARLVPVALVVGAAGALLSGDLREQFMLGDSGSNVLGAVLGYGVVITTAISTRWIVIAVLLALNLVSEVVSFSRVIDGAWPLRRLDRLGSPHRPG